MKKIILYIFFGNLLISCSTTTEKNSENRILGEWVWIESSGGLAGTTETPESTQQEIRLEISDTSIQNFVNGTLESDRTYSIRREESVLYGDEREMIIYNNGFKQIYSTHGNQLILTGDCNDCFQSRYKKN